MFFSGCLQLSCGGLTGLVQLRGLEELELTNCPGATQDVCLYLKDNMPKCLVIRWRHALVPMTNCTNMDHVIMAIVRNLLWVMHVLLSLLGSVMRLQLRIGIWAWREKNTHTIDIVPVRDNAFNMLHPYLYSGVRHLQVLLYIGYIFTKKISRYVIMNN